MRSLRRRSLPMPSRESRPAPSPAALLFAVAQAVAQVAGLARLVLEACGYSAP